MSKTRVSIGSLIKNNKPLESIEKRLKDASGKDIGKGLLIAAKYGRYDVIKLLLRKIKNINDYNLSPVYEYAYKGRHAKIIKKLLDTGKIKDHDIRDSLVYAAKNNYIDLINVIIENPKTTKKTYLKVAAEAARNGYLNTLKYILDQTTFNETDMRYILIRAASNSVTGDEPDQVLTLTIVKYLLDTGNITEEYADTYFASACAGGDIPTIIYLMDTYKVNINLGLIRAAENGHVEVVKLLLDEIGVKINTELIDDLLSYAGRHSHYDVIKVLLDTKLFSDEGIHKTFIDVARSDADISDKMAVIKLLLSTGMVHDDTIGHYLYYDRDKDGNIIKLLLKTGRVNHHTAKEVLETSIQLGDIDVISIIIKNYNIESTSAQNITGLTSEDRYYSSYDNILHRLNNFSITQEELPLLLKKSDARVSELLASNIYDINMLNRLDYTSGIENGVNYLKVLYGAGLYNDGITMRAFNEAAYQYSDLTDKEQREYGMDALDNLNAYRHVNGKYLVLKRGY